MCSLCMALTELWIAIGSFGEIGLNIWRRKGPMLRPNFRSLKTHRRTSPIWSLYFFPMVVIQVLSMEYGHICWVAVPDLQPTIGRIVSPNFSEIPKYTDLLVHRVPAPLKNASRTWHPTRKYPEERIDFRYSVLTGPMTSMRDII
jgi:hypothetical protein